MTRRIVYPAVTAAILASIAAPASAQLFLKPPQFEAGPVTGAEPGIMPPLPGATPEEQTAGLIWSLRLGLNVAALQCDAFPTLMTVRNYNAMLANHAAELKGASDTLEKYFRKQADTVRAGQRLYDAYQNRLGSSYSAVSAQRTFCQTAASVGRDAIWAPRGSLGQVAIGRLRELRGSLTFTREPLLVNPWLRGDTIRRPNLSPICWDKKGVLKPICATY